MTVTTWTEEAAAMSNRAASLKKREEGQDEGRQKQNQGAGCRVQGAGCRVQGAGCRVQGAGCRVQGAGAGHPTHPSARGHSRLGPRTMAMLPGVILLTACCSDSRDRNWTRYLMGGGGRRKSNEYQKEEVLHALCEEGQHTGGCCSCPAAVSSAALGTCPASPSGLLP